MAEQQHATLYPNSVAAEEALLGSILIDPDLIADLANRVTPDDFYITRHAWIYETMLDMARDGVEIDYLTVVEQLRARGRLAEIGGAAYITYLVNNTPTALHAGAYGELLIRARYRRQALDRASAIAKAATDDQLDTTQVQDAIEEHLAALRESAPRKELYLHGPDALAYYADLVRGRNADDAPDTLVLPWEGLARAVPGIKPGKVVLVSGFSGEGKTIVLEQLAEWWAMLGHRVLYITTELTREDMLDRAVCRHLGVPYHELASRTVDADAILRRFGAKAADWLPRIDYWETGEHTTARGIFAEIQRAARHGRKLIFIDYLSEAVGFNTDQRNLKDAIDAFFRTLHTFAKSNGVTVVIASQQSNSDFGPRIFGSSVPHQKSALHLRIQTETAHEARVYNVDDRVIAVRTGDRSPMIELYIEKNTFGPAHEGVHVFKDGARYRFLDEGDVKFSVALTDGDLEREAQMMRARMRPQQQPIDFGTN